MDYVQATSVLPSKSLGSTVRDNVIDKIQKRITSKAYNSNPELIKQNRKTLKNMRNNIKKSYKGATQKHLLRRRFNNVNTLAHVFGVEENTLSEVAPVSAAASIATAPALLPLELSPENIASLADLQSQIQAIDFSIEARSANEERLSKHIVIEQNDAIDKRAQTVVKTKVEKLGFTDESETSEPEKVFIKTDSDAKGDCLPSSIYLAAKERPEVAEIMSGLDLPMENETRFIRAFRNLLAGSVRAGSLPSESPGEDIYTRARDLFVSKETESYTRLKESFTQESRDALQVIEKNPNDREGFIEAYARFIEKMGNWMTHNEYVLINQILSALNLVVFSFSNPKQIPAHLSKKVNGAHVLYVYNPDQTHYVYFSFTVPKNQEEAALENLKQYIKEKASKRLLLDVRSEKAGLASQKQRLQANAQRIRDKTRAETPPRGKMPYWMTKSIASSPQSLKSYAPAPAPLPFSPLSKKPGSILTGSPSESVSSKTSKKRYDPLTGEEFKGTTEEWVKLLRNLADLAELDKIKSRLF